MNEFNSISPFNSPLETGLRSLCILVSAEPRSFDLQQLIALDYLVVHTGDVKGAPSSLHPESPSRNGELLVRRKIVERGLSLMESKNLISKFATTNGFQYKSEEFAPVFIESLTSSYIKKLLIRAQWITKEFQANGENIFPDVFKHAFDRWTTEFQFQKLSLTKQSGV